MIMSPSFPDTRFGAVFRYTAISEIIFTDATFPVDFYMAVLA
jgi:hypothetical protein